jgi:hypothetical protein
LGKGKSKASAAKIAQAKTGKSLKTGKAPKAKKGNYLQKFWGKFEEGDMADAAEA